MKLAKILDIAAGIAQVDEPLWVLIRDEIIPNEESRLAMIRQAFGWELTAGRANKPKEAQEARELRQFLRQAPVDVPLSDFVVQSTLVAA